MRLAQSGLSKDSLSSLSLLYRSQKYFVLFQDFPESPRTAGDVIRTELCPNILMRNNYPAVIFTILMEKAIKILPRVPEAPIFISTKSNNSRSFFLRSRPSPALVKLTDYGGERRAAPIILLHCCFSTNHTMEIAKLLTKLLGKH